VPLLWGAQSATDQVIRLVQDHYNSAKTLRVDFTEQYSMQGHARPVESGVLTLQKQGKMRWDYMHPAGKLFVSDGKLAYLYTARDNRVEKVPLKDTEDMRAPLAFLLGHLDLKKEFRDFQSQHVDGGMLLTAVAKNDRLPYKSIQMLVRTDGSIAGLTVFGQDGSVLKHTFSHERVGLPVAEALFHFTVPPGAEVVNAVEYGVQGN
jgi:outer membrane lipoprotein carrier protein